MINIKIAIASQILDVKSQNKLQHFVTFFVHYSKHKNKLF